METLKTIHVACAALSFAGLIIFVYMGSVALSKSVMGWLVVF